MKNILALFIVLLFAASSGCGSQNASSHDFIDLETNYEFSDVSAPLYKYLKENDRYYPDNSDDSYIKYLCDEETDWEAITFSVSIFCADISCPLRGLDANGCIEHCKKFLERPTETECAPYDS